MDWVGTGHNIKRSEGRQLRAANAMHRPHNSAAKADTVAFMQLYADATSTIECLAVMGSDTVRLSDPVASRPPV
jgi:hypothetical protein